MLKKINLNIDKIFFVLLSLLFVLTIQIFDIYKGNAAHLIHSIKFFDDNKLQNDWIANQDHHLPLFAYFNYLLIKIFSSKVIYLIHALLLGVCSLSLFLISKNLFPKLKIRGLYLIWFAFFTIFFHENSFFSGVAGQSVIDAGYQPASYGVFFFVGVYFFLKGKDLLSILFICLAASFHPTYVLHSGFLVLGILFSYLMSKKYSNLFKIIFTYICLILPITIYIIINFIFINKEITEIGKIIMYERISHHANIHQWLSYKDIIFLLVYFISLFLIRNNKRFFILFLVLGLCSISLSVVQYFLDNKSLALAFPWRSSVFIAPLSLSVIISFLVSKINVPTKKLNVFAYTLIIITTFFFIVKSHYLKNLNLDFNEKLKLTNSIKEQPNSIERILIPTNLDYVRMYSGFPIFVDWKHHAFRYDQIIHWKERLDLTNNFYGSITIGDQIKILKKIQKIENISHIIIKKNKLFVDCEDLIDHDVFMFVNIESCFKNYF
tara:strand:- start:1910 stop:3388 length:1479 start_codon:yes stop_codon:yes gene_type:complete